MSDNDEPQYATLKERIAALNQQKTTPIAPSGYKKPAPPPPPYSRTATDTPTHGHQNGGAVKPPPPSIPSRPAAKSKPAPPPLPRRDTGTSAVSSVVETPEERKLPPQLPSRTASSQSTVALRPALPSRTSTQNSLAPSYDDRRTSVSSEASYRSTGSQMRSQKSSYELRNKKSASSLGQGSYKLPPTFDAASLPPLPPTRRELEAKAAEEEAAAKARPFVPTVTKSETTTAVAPVKPGLPPRLPSRTKTNDSAEGNGSVAKEERKPLGINGFGDKHHKPMPPNDKGWTIGGFGTKVNPKQKQQWDQPPPVPTRMASPEPPPIPISSRPSMAQIQAARSKSDSGNPSSSADLNDCWVCRDWSGPDNIAAQFPISSLPRRDTVNYLAQNLCSPFPSYTDKARAIFTWFHHNIAYDTASFFGKCITRRSNEDTIFSGLAVCSGYAQVYEAIATAAGLDCEMVVGHGKGWGYTKLKPGDPIPAEKPDGHAWNAVRIDGGRWHLLDACWGAGHLETGTNIYKKEFNPKEFTRTTVQFGESHFPQDPRQQFRPNGQTITWREYMIGNGLDEPPVFYTNAHGEGLLESSISPAVRQISVHSDEVVRFQFSKLCEHWRSETHGLGPAPLLLLNIHGKDGRKEDMVEIETDGYWHWCDVRARDLGAPGQVVQVAQVTTIGGKDARGVSAKEYFGKKGKVGMGWTFLLKWELV